MEPSSSIFHKLKHSVNLSDEVDTLKALLTDLNSDDSDHNKSADLEEEWLSMAADNLGEDEDDIINPYPKLTPIQLFAQQNDLNQFTCYVFKRRFGWSEVVNGESVPDAGRTLSSHQRGKVALEKEAQHKARLNEILDELIRWYLSQPISQALLQSLRHTFNEATNSPVVRNQTVVHVMDWLRRRIDDRGSHQHIDAVYQLMLCGLTDIWSAIRNAAVSRLSPVLDKFSLSQLEVFFMSLAQICQSKESTWQSIEGSLMAITTILKRFQWAGKISPEVSFNKAASAQFILKFGKQELSQLPEFLTSNMHTIVYPLLAHRQLSIRENATRAFSAFLSRCEMKEALTSFTEAVTRLRQSTDQSSLPHLEVLRKDYRFLNAYEAEGLLGVCLYLIKHISPGFLLPNWPDFFSIFNLYLMHPASTVRQATSAIFKYLVAKDSNNPSMLKLVLQDLCANWDMNFDILTCDMTSRSTMYTSDLSNGAEQSLESKDSGVDNMNRSGSENEMRQQRKRHLSGGKYCSITSLCALDQENNEGMFCKAWEWREGRLFAYELIVKFLIINHIHYLFPAYALPPSKFDGTVSTDDSITPSHQSRMPPQKHIQKSLSHAGTTLKQALPSHGRLRKTMSQDETLIEQDESAKRERAGSDQDFGETKVKDDVLTRSGSERRKKSIEERRLTRYRPMSLHRSRTLAEGKMYDRPMPKHYSYYKGDKSKKQTVIASSLLEQTRIMDAGLQNQFTLCRGNGSHCVKSTVSSTTNHDMKEPPLDVRNLLNSIKALEIQSSASACTPQWLQHLELDSLSNILGQMLVQTIGCLGDSRWELRRMGHQALPLITECIRWYDMGVLTTLWDTYYTPDTTLASYGCALSLRFSLHHATKLEHFLERPPASWKDPESCQRISLSIVKAIHKGIERWCSVARRLVQRPIMDKLSVVSMEILMLAYSFFPQLVPEIATYGSIILDCLHHTFYHAYPGHSMSKPPKQLGNLKTFHTPTNGCLSCCMKPSSVKPYPQQVERHMLSEIHSLIPIFIRGCQVESASTLLPILIHHIHEYHGDEDIAKSMLDGTTLIVLSITETIQTGVKLSSSVIDNIQLAFQEITVVLQDKALDISTLRHLLEIFLSLSHLTESTEHLQLVFVAVGQRLEMNGSSISQLVRNTGSSEDDDSAFGSSNLAFRSNDIPASPVDDPRISDEDDDEDRDPSAHNHLLSESVALNASSSSSNTPRLSVSGSEMENRALTPSATGDDEDGDSDWDSWDEEEEDQSMTSHVFSEFLKCLKAQYSVEQAGGHNPFQVELSNARDRDRKLITSLLN